MTKKRIDELSLGELEVELHILDYQFPDAEAARIITPKPGLDSTVEIKRYELIIKQYISSLVSQSVEKGARDVIISLSTTANIQEAFLKYPVLSQFIIGWLRDKGYFAFMFNNQFIICW